MADPGASAFTVSPCAAGRATDVYRVLRKLAENRVPGPQPPGSAHNSGDTVMLYTGGLAIPCVSHVALEDIAVDSPGFVAAISTVRSMKERLGEISCRASSDVVWGHE